MRLPTANFKGIYGFPDIAIGWRMTSERFFTRFIVWMLIQPLIPLEVPSTGKHPVTLDLASLL